MSRLKWHRAEAGLYHTPEIGWINQYEIIRDYPGVWELRVPGANYPGWIFGTLREAKEAAEKHAAGRSIE